jgi:hypothetical protein
VQYVLSVASMGSNIETCRATFLNSAVEFDKGLEFAEDIDADKCAPREVEADAPRDSARGAVALSDELGLDCIVVFPEVPELAGSASLSRRATR